MPWKYLSKKTGFENFIKKKSSGNIWLYWLKNWEIKFMYKVMICLVNTIWFAPLKTSRYKVNIHINYHVWGSPRTMALIGTVGFSNDLMGKREGFNSINNKWANWVIESFRICIQNLMCFTLLLRYASFYTHVK